MHMSIRRRSGFALFAAALASIVAVLASAAPASAAGPALSAHALFARVSPYDPSGCLVLKLDVQATATTLSADYWATDECAHVDYAHFTGTTSLTPAQVSLGSFASASLTNATVDVTQGGYFQQFTFNLTWTGSGNATISHPVGGPGEVARQTSASVSGTALDLVGNPLFSGSDVSDAEIAQVLHAG